MAEISGKLTQDMVTHWLSTRVNGYLGSNYGQDLKRIIANPMATPKADQQIAKLRSDVKVLGLLPSNAVNLYSVRDTERSDRLKLFVEIAGTALPVDGV